MKNIIKEKQKELITKRMRGYT